MDLERRHNSTVPLITRLDHLDFIVKRLESKHDSTKWATTSLSEIMPLDLAVREAYFKGSLIDRITSLEHRLLQLLLEMDSGSTSRTSTLTPSQDTSSSQEHKRELSGSSATFNFPNLQIIPEPRANHTNYKPEIQAQATTPQPVEQKTIKKPTAAPVKVQPRKKRSIPEANKPSSRALNKKPQKPRTSLYIRLLGC